ncbi:site-2 protease family protein [Eisenibacter elegans]|uniref:site-2 protease family protein n=1 Tax=Eisenibacter elegans TaxID=997 RepID=UPI0003F7259C|nr:site-2 protease family protein [Eisenibacter elegans]
MLRLFRRYGLHLLLFCLTVLTTTLAGAEWITGRLFFVNEQHLGWSEWMTWAHFKKGLAFSIPFLTFLTVHEFGHYFTARWHKVRVTLPYYIPLWLGITATIGTAGAFIRIKSPLQSRTQLFDIGVAGPLAGFVVAFGVLVYGFWSLPEPEYIFDIHPEYAAYGLDYAPHVYQDVEGLKVGKSLLFMGLEWLLVRDPARMPNAYEIVHYPWLFAGYIGLLFTALNLMPIGQLDGGHILYGMFGQEVHQKVAPVLFTVFVLYAGLGIITPYDDNESLLTAIPIYVAFLYLIALRMFVERRNVLLWAMSVFTVQFLISFVSPTTIGYAGWLLYAFLLGRVLGIYHPPAIQDAPLSPARKALGWLSLVIFILCFSPRPFMIG